MSIPINVLLNKRAKLILNNGIVLEGIIKEWNDQFVRLISLDETSSSFITHPKEDIRVIKILHDKENEEKLSELEEKFEEIYQQPSENELRVKNLAELKSELIKQDKKIIAQKLREHYISGARKVEYGQPRFFKK